MVCRRKETKGDYKVEYSMNIIKELQKYESTSTLDNIYCEALKAKNLDVYLSTIQSMEPEAILVGESPVYKGSQKTGIPFTDEYKIGNEKITLLHHKDQQGHIIKNDTTENLNRDRSSAIIWNELGIDMEHVLLWNIFPFYAHEEDFFVARRQLTPEEEKIGYHFLELILEEFPSIKVILVAGEIASHVILKHEELKKKYHICYISHPNAVAKEEFIARFKKAFELKENIIQREDIASENEVSYEYRRRWADTDKNGHFYCRALNKILPKSMMEYCKYCPCNLHEDGYCGYYDFNRDDQGLSLRKVKRRYDLLIQAHLIPLFPDYKIRINKHDLLIEQAFQFIAELYRDRISLEANTPYLFHLMEVAMTLKPYLFQIEVGEPPEEIYVAILFHNILNGTKVPSGKIAKEFGEYIRSLIDPNAENHIENLLKIEAQLREIKAPSDIIMLFKRIFKMEYL